MWSQETNRVLKSKQVGMGIMHMCCLNIRCPPCHRHNGFMATDGLGRARVRVHVASTQNPKTSQFIIRATNIIRTE